MANTPRLGMPYLVAGQAQKEITHNDALNDLDSLAQISVINRTTTTPPVSPADGDSYIIGTGATGAWTGSDNAVASYYSGWRIKPPKQGWFAYVQAESVFYLYDGSAWNVYKEIAPLGSAAAPSYSFIGDSDTGIYSPGANQLAIATNGTQRLTVDASGNTSVNGGLNVSGTAQTGTLSTANHTITSASSTSLAIGPNGTTNPVLQIDASTASVSNGFKFTGSAGGSGAFPVMTVQGTDANLGGVFIGKGDGAFRISNASTSTTAPSTSYSTMRLRNLSNTVNNLNSIAFENSNINRVAVIDSINESQTTSTGSLIFSVGVSGTMTQTLKLDSSSNIVIGTAAIATTATNGFLYIPTCAGAPTGTPTSYTGRAPMVYDTTNNKLCIYNGAWKTVTLT